MPEKEEHRRYENERLDDPSSQANQPRELLTDQLERVGFSELLDQAQVVERGLKADLAKVTEERDEWKRLWKLADESRDTIMDNQELRECNLTCRALDTTPEGRELRISSMTWIIRAPTPRES